MAKEDNFDFDTEDKGKFNLDFSFIKNLTQKQKETILMIVVAVVAVVLIVVIGLLVVAGNNGGGIFGGSGSSISTEISHIYISTPPNKTTYSIGADIDYSGLSIVVNTSSSFSGETVFYDENPEDFKFSGFDSSAAMSNQVITVTYKGCSTTFKIDIEPDPEDVLHLVKVELISMPKTEFKVGDPPSFVGGQLLCTYSDGTTHTTNLTYGLTRGFEQVSGPGEYTITVEFWDGDYCETTSYTITVTE